MKAIFACLSLILVAPHGQVAHGEVRTFVAEGRVNQITDPLGTLNFTYLGAPFSYRFSFDLNAPDLNDTPTLAEYDGISAALTIGTSAIFCDPPRITMQLGPDYFAAGSSLSKSGSVGGSGGLFLGGSLNDLLLPTEPYPLDQFRDRELGLSLLYPHPGESSNYILLIDASVDAFYAVPEPSSLVLLGFGLLLAMRSR